MANLVHLEARVFYGERDNGFESFDDKIMVMETNIYNMNPEIFPYVIERLMENSALDAYTEPINMKRTDRTAKKKVVFNVLIFNYLPLRLFKTQVFYYKHQV